MANSADNMTNESMERKPILLPAPMIEFVNILTDQASKKEKRNVSFDEMVRRAIQQYDPDSDTEDSDIVDAMLNSIINTTNETVADVRKLNRKLDKSRTVRTRGNN